MTPMQTAAIEKITTASPDRVIVVRMSNFSSVECIDAPRNMTIPQAVAFAQKKAAADEWHCYKVAGRTYNASTEFGRETVHTTGPIFCGARFDTTGTVR